MARVYIQGVDVPRPAVRTFDLIRGVLVDGVRHKSVTLREVTLRDLDVMGQQGVPIPQRYKMVAQGCVMNLGGLDGEEARKLFKKLPSIDLWAILIHLRSITFGPIMKTSVANLDRGEDARLFDIKVNLLDFIESASAGDLSSDSFTLDVEFSGGRSGVLEWVVPTLESEDRAGRLPNAVKGDHMKLVFASGSKLTVGDRVYDFETARGVQLNELVGLVSDMTVCSVEDFEEDLNSRGPVINFDIEDIEDPDTGEVFDFPFWRVFATGGFFRSQRERRGGIPV